jgi:hypothetical protein
MTTMKWLRHSWRAAALVALAFAGPLLHAAAPSAATAIQPYTARYQVSYRGLSGGQIEASFKPGASAGQWLYQTRAFPNLFGRIAVSPQARERSTMIVTASGVRPMTFDFNDGSSDTAADVRHEFDWSNNRVTGQAAGKPFDFAGKSFADWQKAGYDVHSLVADPLFVAPDKFNFTLKPASPALKLGFQPIDLSAVGPRRR